MACSIEKEEKRHVQGIHSKKENMAVHRFQPDNDMCGIERMRSEPELWTYH